MPHNFIHQLCYAKNLLFRVKECNIDLLMLTVRNDIFRIRANLLHICSFATSSIVVDIKKHIQAQWFFLLKNIRIQLLIFRRDFPIDLRSTISSRIFSQIHFFAPRSFHDMLKNTKSLARYRLGKFYAKLFFHALVMKQWNFFFVIS